MTWHPDHDPTVDLRDDEALRRAVEERARERMMTRASAESATFVGTLRDMAERRVGATLLLVDGQVVQGTLLAVGADHVVLATDARQHTYVRTDGIALARADQDVRVPVAQGNRASSDPATLLERLARWEPERPVLAVLVRGRGDPLRGRLVAVGENVVSLDVADDRHPSYLPARAIHAIMVDLR